MLADTDKSLPIAANGTSDAEFLSTAPRLSSFSTPLLVLDRDALDANTAAMAAWCAEQGVDLAPHGKTTMAPTLWRKQIDAGAWAITLANQAQLRVAVSFDVSRIQIANALVDPNGLRWLAAARAVRPALDVFSWVDSIGTVDAMNAALQEISPDRPFEVLVELGAAGGRTGARTVAEAVAVADAVVTSPWLRLRGVAGYEGALAHDGSPESLAVVRTYLESMAELHRALAEKYETDEAVVTAGGSAYFDVVADVLAPLRSAAVRVVVRAGAYIAHDDGFYRGISPFSRAGTPLTSAMHAWARVVSRPEPGLVLLDAGKRDVPFDEGLPEPQLLADELGAPTRPLAGCAVTAVNDQHAFLTVPPDLPIRIGQVVRLGLSHPCTAFDKWRVIPVTAGAEHDPVVVDLVRTYF